MLLDSGSDLNERIKHLEAKNLALREEVEAVKCENQAMIPYVELVDKLEADNEALREDYKEANVLLNGYDKLLTKLRDQRDKDQEEIRKFHADNEALRALANEIVVYAGLYEDTYLDTHFLPILQKAKELV